ncbi:MAG: hypothetical protein ACRDNZ_01780 [Streptosporangiaceae bacterium]
MLRLITGFASAYGLELLATVHWVLTHGGGAGSTDNLARNVGTWNSRKGRLFTEVHIRRAADRLNDAERFSFAQRGRPC